MARVTGLLVAVLLGALGMPAGADEPKDLSTLTPKALVEAWTAGGAVARARIETELRRRGARMAHVVRDAADAAKGATQKGLSRLADLIVEDHHRRHQPAGMVYVPAGSLAVPRERHPYGPTAERVKVAAFYLDRTEVTVGAWRRWVTHLEATDADGPRPRMPDADLPASFPITRVTWGEAARFASEQRSGRLPRVDELERAVRGSGLATWPWGERYQTGKARLGLTNDDGPLPVGSFGAVDGPFGALDLVGNVTEWTSTVRQAGRASRSQKALLFGGSYRDRPDPGLTWRSPRASAPRERFRRDWIGFRVAQDVPPLPPRTAD
ncbi:MAG: SUMF1/EgtB/PvdO family nonheme iron enzyme [Planctomycetota bacterium]|nr:SUMF1/EgtB/PvdO family nonheme iron enzyme [Planctomycetota bacterium]